MSGEPIPAAKPVASIAGLGPGHGEFRKSVPSLDKR